MRQLLKLCAVTTALLMLSPMAFAGFIAGSWNLKNLGWGEHKQYEQVAHVAQHMDLIAVQEVMSDEALESLVSSLEQISDEQWGVMASHAIGRGSYRESYAFLWRESKVEYSGGAVVFLDHNDVFSREPFIAKFRSLQTGQEVAMANIHILYGDSVGDRLPEIKAMDDIWEWMAEVYPGTPRIIAGDFNLKPSHPGWEELTQKGVEPSIRRGATTLSTHDGRYANLYDNLWRSPGQLNVTDRGIIRFPELLGISHEVARKTVSDHAPVYIALGDAKLQLTAFDGMTITQAQTKTAANDGNYDCIDLNNASQQELDDLPHIGPKRAEAIAEQGPWSDAASLQRIRGIGPSRVQDIQDSGMICQS